MRYVKFALVGCGRISGKHVGVISKHLNDMARLVAVCDTNYERAKKVGLENNIPFYEDYNEMLKKHPDIEVVNILTESGNHAKHVIDIASKYKKHIVVEKPMALTLVDADNMIDACEKADVKLFVVKQNRYNLPVTKLLDAIENNRFGKIVMGSVRVRWCRKQEYYDQDEWRGTWSMDGGVLSNQASHHIDLLELVLGTPVSVVAKGRTALVDVETEDTGIAIITFESGALGIVEATTAARPIDIEGSLSVLGENGSVEISGFAVNQMKTWNFVNTSEEDNNALKDFDENPPNVYGFGHIKYLQQVCDSILNNHKAVIDGNEGRKSLSLIRAIYESMETGKEVFLDDASDICKLGIN